MSKLIKRRKFIKQGVCSLALTALAPCLHFPAKKAFGSNETKYIKEAMFYKNIEDNQVECEICPNKCKLKDYQRSKCMVKEPRDGKLYSLVYEYPNVLLTEPIEKGPIYHIRPGTKVFAIATAGCNLHCKYCQNWQLALSPPDKKKRFHVTPEQAIEKALEQKCKGIVYTYNDPIVNFEYVYETAQKAKKAKLINTMVTAGYINPKPLKKLAKYIDGFIVGLKGFDNEFYKDIINGELKYVLETLRTIKKQGNWFEVINLVVPGLNDNMNTIRKMCKWIHSNLGDNTPLHFARFWPDYKLKNLPPTPQVALERAREIAMETGINYVYIGNLPGHEASNTYCPKCGKMIIQRLGFIVKKNCVVNGKCKFCGAKIPGVWET